MRSFEGAKKVVSMQNIILRATTLNDIEQIVSLYCEYRENWRSLLDLEDVLVKYPSICAFSNENLVGFAYCQRFAPDILEVANIYVRQDIQSQGIGTQILQKIEKEAKDINYGAVILFNSEAHIDKVYYRSAEGFYIKNDYELISQTDKTRIFIKVFK